MFVQIQNYLINADDVSNISRWASSENDARHRIVVAYKSGGHNVFEYESAGKSMAEFDAIRSQLHPVVSLTRDQLARSLE